MPISNTDLEQKKDDSFRVIIKATAEKAIADLSAQIMKTLKLNETDCQVQTETEDTVFVSIHDPLMVHPLSPLMHISYIDSNRSIVSYRERLFESKVFS